MTPPSQPVLPDRLIGTSLKMYFSHARTLDWAQKAGSLVGDHPLVASGDVGLFLLPQFPSIPACLEAGGPFHLGAQNLSADDEGAFTGEVSGAVLAEIGCRFVEVGHAERRRLFGETEDIVRAKTTAALRNGLVPVLCVGESARMDPEDAAAAVLVQIRSALADDWARSSIVVAYEPVWAIGAKEPADPEYVTAVANSLRARLRAPHTRLDFRLIYGGSAGPGLLTELGRAVDGLFLGRFAHDPRALRRILDEFAEIVS